MKTGIKNRFLLPALIAGLGLIPAGGVMAQTFRTLHSFTNGPDGAGPLAGLILSGATLYGTAAFGGSSSNSYGMVFAVNTNGTRFTNLHSFPGGSDGEFPAAGLILSGSTLYGTAEYGGSPGYGTVFAVNTDGTGFTTLHRFIGSEAANPNAGLILSGNTLYGTASNFGYWGEGTVFAVNTDGTGFRTVHNFSALSPPFSGTNSEGGTPMAGLILSGDTLYGTAQAGGSSGKGTVFKVNTDGTGFTTLHSFTAFPPYPGHLTNSDGAIPFAELILSGNTLYGTTLGGGSSGGGTVFAVNTDGTGFTNLHNFTALSGPYPGTNSGGAYPIAELILLGNTLYGTASGGGSSGNGTVFAVNTDGTGFTTLHNFTAVSGSSFPHTNSDGAHLLAGLILSGNTLYGTANAGGSSGFGTVFSLSLGSVSPPQPCDFLTGGGWITGTPSGAKANFGVAGGIKKNGAFWGHLKYLDHGTGMRVKDTAVTGYAVDPDDADCRIIDYNVTIDGQAGTARVRACDKGKPGRNDIFELQLSNGYFAGGHLGGSRPGGGRIRLHKCH